MTETIKLLNVAERDLHLAKYNGDEYRIRMFGMLYTKHSDKTANGLTKAVIRWVEIHGGQAERINNIGRYIEGAVVNKGFYGSTRLKGKYIPSTGTRGTADISATIKGRSVKIEVKIGKDKQSEAQKKYQADTERSGGVYIIARNLDGFVAEWEKL